MNLDRPAKPPPQELHLLIVGDQTAPVSHFLCTQLLQSAKSTIQREFISEASRALRTHVDSLPLVERERLPSFQNVQELAEAYHQLDGICHPALCSVVFCISQLLQLFQHFEENAHLLPSENAQLVFGLGTGSLIAAAYAVCSNIQELRAIALPTLLIGFVIGLKASIVSTSVYGNDQWRSWSVGVSNITEAQMIEFIKKYEMTQGPNANPHNRCFISAVRRDEIVVGGPPSSLDDFNAFLCRLDPTKKVQKLPFHASYHAQHYHRSLKFHELLDTLKIGPELFLGFRKRRALLSCRTGKCLESINVLQLYGEVVDDILCAPVRLDRVTEELGHILKTKGIALVHLVAMVPFAVFSKFAEVIRSENNVNVKIRELVPIGERPSSSERGMTNSPEYPALAIVGMSGRFPGADNVEEFWKILEAGVDMHRTIPKDRFDIGVHIDPTGSKKNSCRTPYGCFISNPGHFDPQFFNMSPREALQTCPMQRLALVTAYEALEMAGYVPNRTRSTHLSRIGTFYGQTSDDYRDINAAQEIGTYFITRGIRAFGPGRINYYFKFGGPSYSVDTACSSGLTAIQLACTSIRSGECDTAIAGGLSILTSPDLYSGLSRGHFLSNSGGCKTFDQNADGYCRADGVGSVVIKKLNDAVADRDNILGVILGVSTNHSADAISITHPHAPTQAKLYRDVLCQAGTDATEVGYVEMHGTGTQAGDFAEMNSVLDVLAPAEHRRDDRSPLYVGSVKANIAHGEASSGVSALIKSVLILKNQLIPPHVGIKTEMNRSFPDLEHRGVRVPMGKVPFPKSTSPRKILVNNFSAAGNNTAMLIQEPPMAIRHGPLNPHQVHAVTVSGHTGSSLLKNTENLIYYLSQNPNIEVRDLSYTTTVRRRHHKYRLTVTEENIEDTRLALEMKRLSPSNNLNPKVNGSQLVFMFSGQGAFDFGSAKDLYLYSTQFREDIESFDAIAQHQGYSSFIPLIDNTVSKLNALPVATVQIGFVCIQIALCRLWSSWGVRPNYVIGHSLGEYAALHVAGVLSITDVIYLTGYRASLMETLCKKHSHSMLAVAASPLDNTVTAGLKNKVEVACQNSQHETVYSGRDTDIDQFCEELESLGVRFKKLSLPYAFHSSQMDLILDQFESAAGGARFRPPTIPIISTVLGRPLESWDTVNASYLRQHCRQTVQFFGALKTAHDANIITSHTVFLEIGLHTMCNRLVADILGKQTAVLPALERNRNPWTTVVNALAQLHDGGNEIKWGEFHRDFEQSYCLLHLPSYSFNNKDYWIPYENDWTLRKGEPLPALEIAAKKANDVPRLSPSVHRCQEGKYGSVTDNIITYQTELGQYQIHKALTGHQVNGTALCPSSIYADIALTIANHICSNLGSGSKSGYSVADMSVCRPLIIKPKDEGRVLSTYASHDAQLKTLKLQYTTTPSDVSSNEDTTTHATCTVTYQDHEKWHEAFSRNFHLVHGRIQTLSTQAGSNGISKISSELAYRLFSGLVNYAAEYRLMGDIVFSEPSFEASATVIIGSRECDVGFVCSPYWIDAFAHISGFVMNANVILDGQNIVYISHGWDNLSFFQDIAAGTQYTTYVKMCPRGKDVVSGDVWILDTTHHGLAGIISGLKFQRIPRATLNILLPPKCPPPTSKAIHNRAGPMAQTTVLVAEQRPPTNEGLPASKAFSDSVVALIAEELSTEVSELTENDKLRNLGLDSLGLLSVMARIRDSLGIEISKRRLMDCETLEELVMAFVSMHGQKDIDTGLSARSPDSGVNIVTPSSLGDDTVELIREIILQESGISPADLDFNAELSDLGIDSLLELTILASLRDAGVHLPVDFFHTHRTMEAINQEYSSHILHRGRSKETGTDCEVGSNAVLKGCSSRAILLQTAEQTRTPKRLFMFPDGSGSPAAYAGFSELHPNFELYGLTCPFIDNPTLAMSGSIEETVKLYIGVIKQNQPTGPYYLGGWSVGGVLAFEAAKQVHAAGDSIALLLLIDAPCPIVMPPMSISFVKSLLFNNILGAEAVPDKKQKQILGNFEKTLSHLRRYQPTRFFEQNAPQTGIVWAKAGVDPHSPLLMSNVPDGDAVQQWILNDRDDFGGNGWEKLIPPHKLKIVATGGTHFSMMRDPNIIETSRKIREILAELDEKLTTDLLG